MHCRTNTASMLFVIFGSKFQGLSRTTPWRADGGSSRNIFDLLWILCRILANWASCRAVFRRGCPQLSEETLRSFRKGCRFIRWDLLGCVETFYHRGDQRRHVQVTHVYVACAQGAALLLNSRRLCFSKFFKKQSTAFLVNLVRSVSVTMRDCHCTSSHALNCGSFLRAFLSVSQSHRRKGRWPGQPWPARSKSIGTGDAHTSLRPLSRKNGTALDSIGQHGTAWSDFVGHGNIWKLARRCDNELGTKGSSGTESNWLGGEKAGAEQRQGSKMFQAYAPLVLAASMLKLKSVWRLHSCKHFFEFVQPYSSGSALNVGWVWLS